jgi:hypothetical protein
MYFDRIEENIAVLLFSMKRKSKLISFFFYCLQEARKGIILILQSPGMCKRQKLQKKEYLPSLRSLKIRIELELR